MIRPAGIYRFAYTDDMMIMSRSTDEWNMTSFEKGSMHGMVKEFKDKVDDGMLTDAILKFICDDMHRAQPRFGELRTDRVLVRWPAGRLENWLSAERTVLELELETMAQDPKSTGILEPGRYTIISEDDHDHLVQYAEIDKPEDIWGEDLELYQALRTCDMLRFEVGKNDKLSAKRIIEWHRDYISRYLRSLHLSAGRTRQEVFLLHRPTGFVERRLGTYTPTLQVGATPCKLDDPQGPRWPQRDAVEVAE